MKSDEEMAEAVVRMIRALGRRCAGVDPDSAVFLRMAREQLEASEAEAVAGWRSLGFSDSQIGRELGTTKQAVAKRWPRERRAA